MIMKKHRGSHVKRGGVIVKEEDYNGEYAVRFQTEQGDEYEFVLNQAQIDRLNSLTEGRIGRCESEDGWLNRLKWWK